MLIQRFACTVPAAIAFALAQPVVAQVLACDPSKPTEVEVFVVGDPSLEGVDQASNGLLFGDGFFASPPPGEGPSPAVGTGTSSQATVVIRNDLTAVAPGTGGSVPVVGFLPGAFNNIQSIDRCYLRYTNVLGEIEPNASFSGLPAGSASFGSPMPVFVGPGSNPVEVVIDCSVTPGSTPGDLVADVTGGTLTLAEGKPDGTLTGLCFVALDTVTIGNTEGRNGNDMPLHNGPEAVFLFSDPSVGSSVGAGVDPLGDLFWKIIPHETLACAEYSLTIDGFYEYLFDTDWSTMPPIYDRAVTRAIPSEAGKGPFDPECPGPLPACLPTVYCGTQLNPGSREPTFLANGFSTDTDDVIISIGNSGLPDPCTIDASLCSGPCAIPGSVVGYKLDISIGDGEPGSGIPITCNGVCDWAVTYFLPGGMTGSGGACGLGDYAIQYVVSTDESQYDHLNGISAFGGYQPAGGAPNPVPDPVRWSFAGNPTFSERIINVVGSSGSGVESAGGIGVAQAFQNGGALNALKLPIGSGAATLGVEIRSKQDVDSALFAYAAASFVALPPPGFNFFGGVHLLIGLDALYFITLDQWIGLPGLIGTDPTGVDEGQFLTAQLPVPSSPALLGQTIYLQGSVFHQYDNMAYGTQRSETTFYP